MERAHSGAAEFEKILDHSRIVGTSGSGSCQCLAGEKSQSGCLCTRVLALTAYKDFLTLWKDADPDLPIMKQAKAEYPKLQ